MNTAMQLFLDILTIVIPVFAVMVLGFLLKRLHFIDDGFIAQTNRLLFVVLLPLLLFYKIGTSDFLNNFNGKLVGGAVLTIAVGFFLAYAYTTLRRYSPAKQGSFCQGSFRGNLAYVGLAVVFNAYGEEGLTRASILMGFMVPALNFFSILSLLLPHHQYTPNGYGKLIKEIVLNPLIIASFAGIAWSFAAIPFPALLDRSLNIATNMTLPLALVAIGGGFSLEALKGDVVRASIAASIKLVWLPLIGALILYLLDVTNLDLSIGVLMIGTPTAMVSYVMASQLKGDIALASSIIMLTTLCSIFTFVIALYLLSFFSL